MGYHPARSAVVAAWGREEEKLPKRFFHPEEDSTVLEYLLDAVWTVADAIYVIFRREPSLKLIEAISTFGVKIIIENRNPTIVSSLLMGFKASRSEHCLVLRENLPFIKPNVLHALFEYAKGYDAALPKWSNGRIEPLLAVYRRKSFIAVASKHQTEDNLLPVVDNLYSIRYVSVEDEIKPLDPDLESFFTIDSAEDLAKAREKVTLKYKM
ncbi:MAG: NTP transferase domain-containing protein [Thaumarchaeota archaeon]|nr:NTP transferase domain-containing protein [Nitrososphaerota archaeon]